MNADESWPGIGAAVRLGSDQEPHHLQQRAFVDETRGVVVLIHGYGGQMTGNLPVEMTVDELQLALASGGDARVAVRDALDAASRRIRGPAPHPYGTGPRAASVIAAVVTESRASLFHLGDNRACLLRSGHLRTLTVDHVADVGVGSGRRRLASRALGAGDDCPDVLDVTVESGDRLLLLNDKIIEALSAAELAAIAHVGAAQVAADALVGVAHPRIPTRTAMAAVVVFQRPRERR